jgi:prepilin-type processing-associated H-X9-DG protein/prepilin-type N-terminal cleavage/methylation domain-containing protein
MAVGAFFRLPRRAACRGGFTLIESLVSMGIITVLIGLIVPAVQRVREAGDRTQCVNNLHQIGRAALNYTSIYKKLPPAITMPYAKQATTPSITDATGLPPPECINDNAARVDSDPNNPFGPNWAVYLLPFIDQADLYRQANVADYLAGYANGNATQRDHWRTVVQGQSIPTYLCPADLGWQMPFTGYQAAPGPWARGNYAANAGPGWWQMSKDGASYTESYGLTGPVMGINYGAVLEQIPDGASTTILFNEVRLGVSDIDPRGVWAMGFPGSSVTAANAIGDCTTPNDNHEGSDDIEGCPSWWYPGIGTRDHMGCSTGYFDLGWPSWQAQARSRHRGGVNTCFCDGSVRFISDYIQQGVWFYMQSTSDGMPYSYVD